MSIIKSCSPITMTLTRPELSYSFTASMFTEVKNQVSGGTDALILFQNKSLIGRLTQQKQHGDASPLIICKCIQLALHTVSDGGDKWAARGRHMCYGVMSVLDKFGIGGNRIDLQFITLIPRVRLLSITDCDCNEEGDLRAKFNGPQDGTGFDILPLW